MDQTASMNGKTCVVTGGTRGLGWASARELAKLGAEVVLVGRSPDRVRSAAEEIQRDTGNRAVIGIVAELSSQESIRTLAQELRSQYASIHVLVNNVGATLLHYQRSVDGIEMTWALNYLNHFLLTNLLLDQLKQAARDQGEARIVEVTSSIYRISPRQFQVQQAESGYNGVQAYAQSKRALITFTVEMARRLAGTGVTINAVTPGWVRTNIAEGNNWWASLIMSVMNRLAYSLDDGVQPIIRLSSSPDLAGITGRFYQRNRAVTPDQSCTDPISGHILWELSEKMSGLRIE